MSTTRLIALILLLPNLLFGATVYVDNTLEADITNGTYSKANRDNSGSDGNAFHTMQAAIYGTDGSNPGADAGDTIYLRGGTYQENYGGAYAAMRISPQLNGTAWTAGNFTTIASYPGEWAIIDGNDAVHYVMGYGSDSSYSSTNALQYIKIERLEVTGANLDAHGAGLAWHGGPVWVRYCYIHDNGYGTTCTGNVGGIKAQSPMGCIVEYCYFENNVGTSMQSGSHNGAHIFFYADYLYTSNTFNINQCNRDNEIRYNYFSGPIIVGYKDKAAQYLMDRESSPTGLMSDMTNETQGNRIHHNIGTGASYFIDSEQDFTQIYNNISNHGHVGSMDGMTAHPTYFRCTYNNTVLDSFISEQIGDDRAEPDLDLAWFCANNIVSGFGTDYYSPSIGCAVEWQDAAECTYDYTWTDTLIDRNLIYQPASASHFGLPNSQGKVCKATRWVSTSAFNTLHSAQKGSTIANYTNATAGLFLGASGANQYITDSTFSVATGVTIADGGIGGNHPYLSGVTIPSYIGAVNPDDSGWVEDVLALATDGNSDGIPDNLLAGTEIDLDDGESSPAPAPPTLSNVTISNGRVQ